MTSQPDWLALATPLQRSALVRLLATVQRAREGQANKMLTAPPCPSDETDAKARVVAVISYLTGDAEDRHSGMEME